MAKVIAFGCFDGITPARLHHIKMAKEYGELTIVIARDETVLAIKGKYPQFKEDERKRVVEELGIADRVILGSLENKYQAIADEKPDFVALGYDQKVFVDNLSQAIESHVRIVRLQPFSEEGSIVTGNEKSNC